MDYSNELSKKEKLEQLITSSIGDVFEVVEAHARKYYDGHYTIMSFTTGVKAIFGTIDLDTGCGRYDLLQIAAYPDAHIAMSFMLAFDDKYVVCKQ